MGTATFFSQKFWTDDQLRTVTNEARAKHVWNRVSDIRGEFRTFSCFWNYCQGLQKGARRLTGAVVHDEERALGELLGIRRGNDVLLRKPKI